MSVFADQGTVAHMVLEQCLTMIYLHGIPTVAEESVGQKFTIEDTDHARLSPSWAKTWGTCPGSVGFAEKFPEPKEPPRDIIFSAEDARAVQMCLDHVAGRYVQLAFEYGSCQIIAERRVSPALYLDTDECDGTSDITLLAGPPDLPAVYCEHIDYKHGKGVPVHAEDPQNAIYFLGTCAALVDNDPSIVMPIKQARLTICQPRCEKIKPLIRSVDIDDVGSWGASFIASMKTRLDAVRTQPDTHNPSEDACRFCAGKSNGCGAQVQAALNFLHIPVTGTPGQIYQTASQMATYEPNQIPPDILIELLQARSFIKGVLDGIEEYSITMLRRGTAPQELMAAFELDRGKTRRQWEGDPSATEKGLKKLKHKDPETDKMKNLRKTEIFKSVLQSPAGIEKILKTLEVDNSTWAAFRKLYGQPDGALILVPTGTAKTKVEPTRISAEDAFGSNPLAHVTQTEDSANV